MSTAAKFSVNLLRPHIVYKNQLGERVPGVTTILGVIAKPELVPWANAEGLAGRDVRKEVQRAADIGTVTHARIEAFVRGLELDESDLQPDVLDRSQNGALRFMEWWKTCGYEIAETELPMVSERWQVGGTLDLLCKDGSALDLVDIKTSKRIYPEHRIQAATYAGIYEEVHGQPIRTVWVCRVGKEVEDDIEMQMVTRSPCVTAFEAALALYRAMQRVGK